MTYFSLRKRATEPDPEPVEEAEEEEAPEAEPEAAPPTGALSGVPRWLAWCSHRIGGGTTLGVHAVAVWACFHYGGMVAITVIVVFALVVALFTPREHIDRLVAWIEKHDPGRRRNEVTELPPTPPIVTVMWQHIGDGPGIHLKTLADRLQKQAPEGEEGAVDRAAIRAKLGALQIPVRASVRDAAGRVNEGVHRDDLMAWKPALPQPGPDTPSEGRSGPGSDAVTCGSGTRRTAVATLLSRLRGRSSRGVG